MSCLHAPAGEKPAIGFLVFSTADTFPKSGLIHSNVENVQVQGHDTAENDIDNEEWW